MRRGHPEGLREAFANSHAEMSRIEWRARWTSLLPEFPYPRIQDGAHTMAFIKAWLASRSAAGGPRWNVERGVSADIAYQH